MPQPASLPDASGDPSADRIPLRPGNESHLERAIDEQEFTPYFQPIVSLDTGAMLAAEALVRWHPSEGDSVPPSGFIDLAEESGLIEPLGRQVLDRAARLLKQWGDAAPARLHVNISPSELGGDARLEEALRRVSREEGVHLGRLCVEISERQARVSVDQVRRLRELGVQVALDDFGTGYASYSLLADLPITDLKLDGSLVRSLDSSERHRAVVRRILDLARDLGIRVVAEGVQTAAQAHRLREAGFRVGQGFLFSHPREPAEFEEILLTPIPRRSSGSSG